MINPQQSMTKQIWEKRLFITAIGEITDCQNKYNMEQLNEKELRLLLVKESNYDVAKAEKLYNFIIGKQPKEPVVEIKPDGIYFILSPTKIIHKSIATGEDKRNSIAVGVKMGDKFANVSLHDAVGGEDVALCQGDKVPCGSEQFFHRTFKEAIADWNGMASTNDIRDSLNPDINLVENEYIPSVAQLHLILLNINEINKALVEAGGDPMKEDWYWSSTEYSSYYAWYVYFDSGDADNGSKYGSYVVRPSVSVKL